MTTLNIVHLAPVTAPRGAVWAAQAAVALRDAVQRLFSRPAETPRSRAEAAEALRHYALSIQQSDPGLAADLYAAADRHDLHG